MRKLIFVLLLMTLANTARPQLNYTAFTIPDSMRKNADAVLREQYIKLSLKSASSGKLEVHQVYTVLNDQGKDELMFEEYSDKFRVLDDAEIKVYDAMGIKKNSYSKKEMNSFNYGDGLVAEGKWTYFNVAAPSYPITVEVTYTKKYKGILSLPEFVLQSAWESVEHSVFEVETPASLGVRYKLLNTDRQPQVTHDGETDLYHWEVKNLVAYKSEKRTGSSRSYEPAVLLAPNKFQLDDYDGDMTSWKNFGKWINDLYVNSNDLPADRKQFYKGLVKDAATDREKARILYNYMQRNMRYVSIQLGIGGFRPFPSSFVDEKKYGDCKALSNYMRSALDAVGIRSNVVIIQGSLRPRNVYADFPANYFNHVILCIPAAKDTTWLECTSTTLPFGELGPFTENRRAMLVTDSGGVLISTPRSTVNENVESFSSHISVNEEGGGTGQTTYLAQGELRDELLRRGFHEMKEDERRKHFITDYEWKQPDELIITSFDRGSNPFGFNAQMIYEKVFSFKAGSKYFFEPRLYPLFDEEIPETEKRQHDYYFDYPYQSIDTTVYLFPKGFTPEALPAPKNITQPFAAYSCNYSWDAGMQTVTIIASLQIKERQVKAADYSKLLEFKKQVQAALNEKLVMKKE